MQNRDFDEFLRRQQLDASSIATDDWNRERDEWLGHLGDLYRKVESLLGKYISSGQIRFEYKSIELNEENIGLYTAKQMVLRIGRQDIVLKPIGTLLIGFKGRVDVEGPVGRAQIALVDNKAMGVASLVHVSVLADGNLPVAPKKPREEIEWAWKIVTPPPERRFVEITQQTLFQLILDVANV